MEHKMSKKRWLFLAVHAFVGWAFCAATMGVGMMMTSLHNALIIHAFAAPIIFFIVTFRYFSYSQFLSPLLVAISFIVIVMAIDFFLVALIINRSLEMFTSLLGTWIPFALIFISTYLSGLIKVQKNLRLNS
jgi:hypothetical protein